MANEQVHTSAGTIMRGADGSLYFLRNEVLEACKITEQEMAESCAQLLDARKDEVQGFSITAGGINAVAVSGPFTGVTNFNVRASSTVMCPGTCKDISAFVIQPAFIQ